MEPNTILEHFLLLFPMSLIEEITNQAMIYYQQESAGKNVPANFVVTKETMMAFFGINIAMRLVKLPSVYDYWAGGIIAMPWFRSIMPRDLFKYILRFLHHADNTKDLPRNDP